MIFYLKKSLSGRVSIWYGWIVKEWVYNKHIMEKWIFEKLKIKVGTCYGHPCLPPYPLVF